MTKKTILLMACAALSMVATPAFTSTAHAQVSELKVKKNKSYKHPHSKIELPATLTGYGRDFGRSFFPNALDVSFQYKSGDGRNFISIYIYRKTNADTSIWFDRAKDSIEKRDVFGKVTPYTKPAAFAPLNMENTSGMRVSYSTTGSKFTGTGLMLFPVNGWYVKVRASSETKSPREVEQWMDQALAEIKWPKSITDQPTAMTIAACDDELFFEGGAKAIAPSLENSLLAGLLGVTADLPPAEGEKVEAAKWCRDDGQKLFPSAIYRAKGSQDSYLYALGDSGRAITTGVNGLGNLIKSEIAENDGKAAPAKEYSVSLHVPDKQLSFLERDRLPSPAELMKIVSSERPTSSSNAFGKKGNITIFTDDDK